MVSEIDDAWLAKNAPWFDTNWPYRVVVSVDPDSIQGTERMIDFPLLVHIDAAEFPEIFAKAKSDGSDILVTTRNGHVVLDRDVVEFDAGSGTAEIWVRVESFSKTENRFYLYYGNAAASFPAKSGTTWSPEYRAVYHFDGDPGAGVLEDWSAAGADAALNPLANWTTSDRTNAVIGDGWFFNGSTHHIATRWVSASDSSYVASAWLNNTNRNTDFFLHANPGFWHLSSQASDVSQHPDYAGSGVTVKFRPSPIPLDGEYHHFAWVFDGVADTVKFYYDGQPQPILSTFPSDLDPLYTGRPINPDNSENVGILGPMFASVVADYMDGGADEFRLREGVVTDDWIATEVRNQRSPQGFLTFGVEEVAGATAVGDLAASTFSLHQNLPNPIRNRTAVSYSVSSWGPVRLNVYDVAGRHVRQLLNGQLGPGSYIAHWNARSDSGQRVPRGIYFLRMETPSGTASIKMLLAN